MKEPYKKFSRFHCSAEIKSSNCALTFQVADSTKVTTASYPRTIEVLEKKLNSIFHCKCFNGKGLPFKNEAQDTQIGHLYEHILLEYLADMKYKQTKKPVKLNGVTSWNWKRDQRGVFKINISIGKEDEVLLTKAIGLANGVLEDIMHPFPSRPSLSPDVMPDNGL